MDEDLPIQLTDEHEIDLWKETFLSVIDNTMAATLPSVSFEASVGLADQAVQALRDRLVSLDYSFEPRRQNTGDLDDVWIEEDEDGFLTDPMIPPPTEGCPTCRRNGEQTG